MLVKVHEDTVDLESFLCDLTRDGDTVYDDFDNDVTVEHLIELRKDVKNALQYIEDVLIEAEINQRVSMIEKALKSD